MVYCQGAVRAGGSLGDRVLGPRGVTPLAVPGTCPAALQKDGQGRHQEGSQHRLRQVRGQTGSEEDGVRSGDVNWYQLESRDHQAGLQGCGRAEAKPGSQSVGP